MPVFTITHLRNLVQRREKLFADESYRKNVLSKPQFNQNTAPRRNIAELDNSEELTSDPNSQNCIDAVNFSSNSPKCWNCDQIGHFWDDCVQSRTVFCYGCSTKNVYKPQCARCAEKKLGISKNFPRQNTSQKT